MARHILSLSQKFSHYYLRSNSITHNKHEKALQNHNFKSPHDNSLDPGSNPYHSILAYSVWQALIRTRGWRKKTRPSFNLRQTISPSNSCDNKILTVLAFSTRLKMTPSANKAFPASTNNFSSSVSPSFCSSMYFSTNLEFQAVTSLVCILRVVKSCCYTVPSIPLRELPTGTYFSSSGIQQASSNWQLNSKTREGNPRLVDWLTVGR